MVGILEKLHVIAISKKLNSSNELDVYVYKDDKIFLYSPQWELEINWNYEEKVEELVFEVENNRLDWTDIEIQDGQEIKKQGNKFLVDNKRIEAFKRLTDETFAIIGPVTSKIYNEYVRSREKGHEGTRKFFKDSFNEGLFTKQMSDIVETSFDIPLEEVDLNSLDKQIIVRTKIEGRKFIINFVKNLLHSNDSEKEEYCAIFFSRLFMLETQNFIKVE